MENNERKTASPKTHDRYENLVNTLDKVESQNEYTGSAVTPVQNDVSAELEKLRDKAREESRKRQK